MVAMNVYVIVEIGLAQKKPVKTPKKIEKNQNKMIPMMKTLHKKVARQVVEHGPKIVKHVIE
jgi:hypothetical protein